MSRVLLLRSSWRDGQRTAVRQYMPAGMRLARRHRRERPPRNRKLRQLLQEELALSMDVSNRDERRGGSGLREQCLENLLW
jgi:hypothetical protein